VTADTAKRTPTPSGPEQTGPDPQLLHDVIHGLDPRVRKLPPKYFYDDAGARLFERICELDEYYPTRTELSILRQHAPDIGATIGPRARIVELGSGSGVKTRLLLQHLIDPVVYVPIDIAETQLHRFAQDLRLDFPELAVEPVAADYTERVILPDAPAGTARTIAFFPGSTIGNFEPDEAADFLIRLRRLCGADGGLILGTDMHKDLEVLHAAYNDPPGVTAAFNLNLLHRVNRELGANFDPDAFAHDAVYDVQHKRIEMRLVCVRECSVRVPRPGEGDASFSFQPGEFIVTEYSHKYTEQSVRQLADRTGWRVHRRWTDARQWFSVWLLKTAANAPPS
jgi:dimethylhistidine N-methyltransferase